MNGFTKDNFTTKNTENNEECLKGVENEELTDATEAKLRCEGDLHKGNEEDTKEDKEKKPDTEAKEKRRTKRRKKASGSEKRNQDGNIAENGETDDVQKDGLTLENLKKVLVLDGYFSISSRSINIRFKGFYMYIAYIFMKRHAFKQRVHECRLCL